MKNFLSTLIPLLIVAAIGFGVLTFIQNYEPKSDMKIEDTFLVNDDRSITKKSDVSSVNMKAKLTVDNNLTITVTNNTSSSINIDSKAVLRKVERTTTQTGYRYKISQESQNVEVVRGYLETSRTKYVSPYSEEDVIIDCSRMGLFPGDYLLTINGYNLYFHLENLP